MKKTLFLLLVIALMLFAVSCSANAKDELAGTYQKEATPTDKFFLVIEKTEEENIYIIRWLMVKKNSAEAISLSSGNSFYTKVSDKKLNTEEMKKLVTKY